MGLPTIGVELLVESPAKVNPEIPELSSLVCSASLPPRENCPFSWSCFKSREARLECARPSRRPVLLSLKCPWVLRPFSNNEWVESWQEKICSLCEVLWSSRYSQTGGCSGSSFRSGNHYQWDSHRHRRTGQVWLSCGLVNSRWMIPCIERGGCHPCFLIGEWRRPPPLTNRAPLTLQTSMTTDYKLRLLSLNCW